MLLHVMPHAFAFRPQHQCDRAGGQGLRQRRLRLAGKPDAPVPRFGDVFERARQIDHPHPRYHFERARGRLGKRARFGRRVPVLRQHRAGVERGGGAHDRAHVVRIGDLIEYH